MRKIIVLAMMIVSAFTHAAGRVGGGKLSNDDDLYQTKLPAAFSEYEIFDETVRLVGPMATLTTGVSSPQFIEVYRFVNESPIKGNSRQVVEDFYTQNSWQKIGHTDLCIDVYVKKNVSAITYVAVWGNQAGVVLVGQNNKLTGQSINQMIQNIELLPGACSWK